MRQGPLTHTHYMFFRHQFLAAPLDTNGRADEFRGC
jgi:hypothetical protein